MSSPRKSDRFGYLTLILATVLLTGCLGGNSPVIRYYVLNPVTAATPASSTSKLNIEISAVHLPQYLDRPQIVTRTGNNQLKLSELNQWGGNLRKNMIRTLAVNISRLLDTPNVAVIPHRSSLPADYQIAIEIIQFEIDTDQHVHLTAQWRISSGLERKAQLTQITQLRSAQGIAAGDYDAVVASMSQQYAKLSELIAQQILQLNAG